MLTTDRRATLAYGGLDVAEVEARVSATAGQPLVAVEARTVFMGTALVLQTEAGDRYLLDAPEDETVWPLRRRLRFLPERAARRSVAVTDLRGRR